MIKKSESIWLDGKLVPWDDANVHVLTHTLHYGLGAFEGIRCYEREDGRSQVFRLREHIRRLVDSARMYTMDVPWSQEDLVLACKETLRANRLRSAYLRPLVFLGDGAMGLYALSNPVRVMIGAWEWGAYLGDEALEHGIRAKVSSFTRNHPNSMMSKGKICGHYVNSIVAKREVMAAGYQEAIMLDHEGYISEASGENIFIIRDGVVKTPPYSSSILGGITRDTVVRLLKDAGIPIQFSRFARDELYLADEVFMVGTAAEVTPVREVDDRRIGDGRRGEITTHVQSTYFDIVKGSNSDYPEWLDWVD
ncbi:MAG: branched-chain amino acid transaminase [Deltaproteobacteria bacterium]|nr:MAG: branched-chain amino acid transaminase [Deltaproteobacteria bacterium]